MVHSKSMGSLMVTSPGRTLYAPNSDRFKLRAFSAAPEVGQVPPLEVADAKQKAEEAAGGYEPEHRVRLRSLRHPPASASPTPHS